MKKHRKEAILISFLKEKEKYKKVALEGLRVVLSWRKDRMIG